MDEDELMADGGNTEKFYRVYRVIITKLNAGYKIEFEPNRQSRDLLNAKSFYWRFHPTVEIRNLNFRPEGRSPKLYLKLRFNRLYNVEITYGETCTLGVQPIYDE